MSRTLLSAGIGLTALFFAPVALAQSLGLSYGTSLSIDLSPQNPAPNQAVQLTLHASGIDLADSTIVWMAGGKTIAQGIGKDFVGVVAGALGSETPIEADVSTPDGTFYSAQVTVAPTQLDVLVDSDSYTPPFYLGRALPSPGTDLLFQAIAHFKRPDGTTIPDSQITYTWKQGGEVLGGISGRGRSSATIPVQHLSGDNIVTVDAVSSDGSRSAETTATVPLVEATVDLYEDHPLYGLLFNNALGAFARIAENEMTFAAIPYFAQIAGPNDPRLSYAWRVNDTAIARSVTSPSEITINADNSTGQAALSLDLTHADNYLMSASGAWNINFSAPAAQSPFGSSPF
jgi:hypothetical protein